MKSVHNLLFEYAIPMQGFLLKSVFLEEKYYYYEIESTISKVVHK